MSTGIDNLFSGNALRAVDGEGRTILPPFVLAVLDRRRAGARLMFGAHEQDPCINGYDEGYAAVLHAEIERRRLTDEARGIPAAVHHSRARRTFGAVERASYDAGGRITLPPMMRRRSGIGARALFIGTGGSFEIWDPDLARRAEDRELRDLAEFACQAGAIDHESEVER